MRETYVAHVGSREDGPQRPMTFDEVIEAKDKQIAELQLRAADCDNWKRTAQELGDEIYSLKQASEIDHSQPVDNVNYPQHYTHGGIETIDFIRAKLTPEEFAGYCKGNVLKYVARATHKGGIEDLRKAGKYIEFATGGEQ